MNKESLRAALYTRVSTEMQVREGYSLDAQLQRLQAFCESQGWIVSDIYVEEGESAKDTDRPQLHRLMDAVRAGQCDVVLVWRLDRLTRSVTDLYQLLQFFGEHGVAFRSATEVFDTSSAVGRLFLTIVAAMAQWERENLAERVVIGQIGRAREGKRNGGMAPFGYRLVAGRMEIYEPEAVVVREIFARYVRGAGYGDLLNWLNDAQAPQLAPRTGRWTRYTMREILRNPVYIGQIRYGYRNKQGRKQPSPMIVDSDHEPIIPIGTWQRAESMLKMRAGIPNRSGTTRWMLTGIAFCGLCGSRLHGKINPKRNGEGKYRYYICAERVRSHLCDFPGIPEPWLMDLVWHDLRQYDLSARIAAERESQPQSQQAIKRLETTLRQLENHRQRFMDAFAEGHLTSAELRAQLDRLQGQQVQIEDQFNRLKLAQERLLNMEAVESALSTLLNAWEATDAPERRELLRMLIRRIEVYPKRVEIDYML